jgi:hypothetical protein
LIQQTEFQLYKHLGAGKKMEAPEGDYKAQVFDDCPICKEFPSHVCQTISEFCVRVAKTGSLAQVHAELQRGMPAFMMSKNMSNDSLKITDQDIENHILYCIATREPVVTQLVTRRMAMGVMLTSSDASKILASAKLLQQSAVDVSK